MSKRGKNRGPRMTLRQNMFSARFRCAQMIQELEAIGGMEDAVALLKKAFALQKAADRLVQLAPNTDGLIYGQTRVTKEK